MERSMEECSAMRRKKSSLTLDLSNSRVGRKTALQGHSESTLQPHPKGFGGGSVVAGDLDPLKLTTPDCGGLLKLTTAELERFLLQPNAPLIASPSTPLLFLKTTNEEQEAYARGFMDALMEIRRKQMNSFGGIVCLDGPSGSSVAPSLLTLTPVSPFAPLNADAIATGSLCPQLMPVNLTNLSSRSGQNSGNPPGQRNDPPGVQWNDLPSTANESSTTSSRPSSRTEQTALGNTPPQSPIDMSDQERIKLERKREKNRRAAQKCRTRKLERIARLDLRTKQLREQNARLVQEAADVREQLLRLKGEIAEHFHNGCFLAKGSDA